MSGLARPRHDAAVIDHLIHRDRQGRVVPLDDHAERISDEENLDSGAIEEAGEGGVVGREHRDALAGLLHLAESIDGDLLQGSPPCFGPSLVLWPWSPTSEG